MNATIEQLQLPSHPTILDAGCGSGQTLDDLTTFGTVSGVEASGAATAAARRRGHAVRVGRILRMPFESGTFDLVTCLDVIEQTLDHRGALRELRRVTKPGGLLVVTVPRHRRYRRRTLRQLADEAGWLWVSDRCFDLSLPSAALAGRLEDRREATDGRLPRTISFRALETALAAPVRLEEAMLRAGLAPPVGPSLLTVFRRPRGSEHR